MTQAKYQCLFLSEIPSVIYNPLMDDNPGIPTPDIAQFIQRA